jgi:hypothetical protein
LFFKPLFDELHRLGFIFYYEYFHSVNFGFMPKLEKFKEKRHEKANNCENEITSLKSYHFLEELGIIIDRRFCQFDS